MQKVKDQTVNLQSKQLNPTLTEGGFQYIRKPQTRDVYLWNYVSAENLRVCFKLRKIAVGKSRNSFQEVV